MLENCFDDQFALNNINTDILSNGTRYIYIIHIINTNYYKVGIADSTEIRLKNLQTANPFELKVIYSKSFIDFFPIEGYIHNFYIKKNVRGEWFEFLNEDVYEIIFFLKKLESSKDIKGEINKRLRLQKKHLENLKFLQERTGSVIRKNIKVSYSIPKIMISKTTNQFTIYTRIKNPENKKFKTFKFKGGINREKNLDVRAVKAEKLKEKVTRLLENGLNPFFDKEDFKKLTF